jgi:transcription-repair coupling factor (superfamily II helicase)
MVLKKADILDRYSGAERTAQLVAGLRPSDAKLCLSGFIGSSLSFTMAAAMEQAGQAHVVICRNKDEAAYVLNDLEAILEKRLPIGYYPPSYRTPYQVEETENANVAIRTEALNSLKDHDDYVIVTFPEALSEFVVSQSEFAAHSVTLRIGEEYDVDLLDEQLIDMHFEKVDYVYEPGQFSVRGGIVDVFSFVNDRPYRIELFGDEVESIREFDPVSQLSVNKMSRLTIVPDVGSSAVTEHWAPFLDHLPEQTTFWCDDLENVEHVLDKEFERVKKAFAKLKSPLDHRKPEELALQFTPFKERMASSRYVSIGGGAWEGSKEIQGNQSPQPAFNKQFDLLVEDLRKHHDEGYIPVVTAGNAKQIERLYNIFDDIGADVHLQPVVLSLKEGFVDHDNKLVVYTDHQIFERYNRFRLKEGFKKTKQALTLQDLIDLKPGDFVTHIDHGVGEFSGLEKLDVQGKSQEAIRLVYRDGDILYVSIHSRHRIAKYTGQEGTQPKLHKLGGATWAKQKSKAKSKVKKLAFDLIKLYAERKSKKGFAYTPDTYLQTELEASFIYEDTPDQETATSSVKSDMERDMPMDRLICGDVGFGKTEIAIRAAFKAVADNKQVAVLVPTTVLSFQHYQSFSARLHDFPAKVDYVNRFRSTKEQKEALERLASGETDIIIGTHKLLGKSIQFKDLGLIIVDEEQKFGVSAKDKLKTLKANVDTLTLSATPIPRTLQFSLMGARDLSIINTPPPNRYPVETKLIGLNEATIRDAISEELSRGGQVFFVHNRIENIQEVAGMISRLVPEARVAIGHGQMDGKALEKAMLDFMDGDYDVLVSTTIIESGIDIPNANTIIINQAQNFGLSDLHQLRGRVGRSNKKAFCYLITPPLHAVSDVSRKRLTAIEQFSDLGSGMSIAMRDLDIRGAGDLLGAEQSGFINDIGFDTYQKILTEAMEELKEQEFKELFKEELHAKRFQIEDVQLETDFEILLPDEYVHGSAERLKLYRELSEIEDDEGLTAYVKRMKDRFGPPPKEAVELFESIKLKWLAKEMAIHRIVIKSGKMIGHFVADQEHPFYQSESFMSLLERVQGGEHGLRMYERNDSLRLAVDGVQDIHQCLMIMEGLVGSSVSA